MVSVYHFWTIVLAIAGMVLYFICFKSTRENVVRIGAAVIEDQSANPETESPAVYVVHRCAVCADFDLRG